MGSAPLHRVRLDWKRPTVGSDLVRNNIAYRVIGDVATFTNLPGKVAVGMTSATPTSPAPTTVVDDDELAHNLQVAYVIVAEFADGTVSRNSISAPITVVNDAPIANNDLYIIDPGKSFSAPARGVLINDTDTDSATTSLTAVLATPPKLGALVLNANGSFTYTPPPGFKGTDSFTYWAKDVSPISGRNVPATVTIQAADKGRK